MKLAHPFIQLPLSFDAARLQAEVAALGEGPWRPHPQKFPGNSMLPLVAVNGEPENQAYRGEMRPTLELERCPYLWQTIGSFGVTVGRTRLMRLAGQAEVSRHADQGYYWVDRVRVHVPVKTQPTVRFECGDAAVNMAAGECWIFDTWRKHRVINANDDQRTHLVCDTVGGGEFWDLVEAGRPHPPPGAQPGWTPKLVEYQPDQRPPLALEAVNVPEVMTPWEAEARLNFLHFEAANHPLAPQVRRACARFLREWRALWARYGESAEGVPDYKSCLDRFIAEVQGPSRQIPLPNDVPMFNVIMTLVCRIALAAAPAAAGKQGEYA